jgi:hypothetical protein
MSVNNFLSAWSAPGVPMRERSRIFEVPLVSVSCFLHTAVLLMPSETTKFPIVLMLQNCCREMAAWPEPEAAFFT